jgi:hypothetical protein
MTAPAAFRAGAESPGVAAMRRLAQARRAASHAPVLRALASAGDAGTTIRAVAAATGRQPDRIKTVLRELVRAGRARMVFVAPRPALYWLVGPPPRPVPVLPSGFAPVPFEVPATQAAWWRRQGPDRVRAAEEAPLIAAALAAGMVTHCPPCGNGAALPHWGDRQSESRRQHYLRGAAAATRGRRTRVRNYSAALAGLAPARPPSAKETRV